MFLVSLTGWESGTRHFHGDGSCAENKPGRQIRATIQRKERTIRQNQEEHRRTKARRAECEGQGEDIIIFLGTGERQVLRLFDGERRGCSLPEPAPWDGGIGDGQGYEWRPRLGIFFHHAGSGRKGKGREYHFTSFREGTAPARGVCEKGKMGLSPSSH